MIEKFFQRHPLLLKLTVGLLGIPGVLFLAASSFSWYFDPVDWPCILFTGPFGIGMVYAAFYAYCETFCCEANKDFKFVSLLKFKGRLVLGVIWLSCLLVFFVQTSIVRIHPVFIEHVSYEQIPHGGIPKGGTDYSSRRLPRGSVYCECTMTEKGFDAWVSSESRWDQRTAITEENPEFVWNAMQKKEREKIIVTDGIKVRYGEMQGGIAIFDRKTNKVYYWTYY